MSNNNMKPSNSNMSIDAVPQWLRVMLKLQQQQIADMHATQQRQYEEIQQLSQQGTHAISTSTESNTKALKECLDAPAYFDASDLTLYSSWRMEMLAKLSVDGDAISSLINQGWYINGRLKDRAKQKFHPWMEALISINEDSTYEGFCTQLRTLDDCLIKLKSIQNSGRRHYIYTSALTNNPATYTSALTDNPATHTPASKNNHDADVMDWIDLNAYTQARVSTV
ncbi:hypothetical protein BDDG_11652 [Blastomyces dermatitidis ATCC 18188]|uniref:Uncharacterized protein n=1 Tax=Ajellomyces dermatitidis (strain ATCC 18188 / CBS 674.68) TaxID=653446 RepID=A0A0J9EKJ5_AJEDA|nr:hypothetical protein BDDG_11652 [Blastomyces dermatitidis ATCC 18188]